MTNQKLAMDRFLQSRINLVKEGGMWLWPDIGESYVIKGGCFYAQTWQGYKALKRIAPKSWHSRIFSNK